MHILFLTDNFPPEVNAPATRTYEHIKEWEKLGAKITVITCFPNFPNGKIFEGYNNKPWQKEKLSDNITIIRVWSYIAQNKGFFKRITDYMSFAVTSSIAGLFVRDIDIIIATSPQFFTTWSGAFLSIVKKKPWVFELRDLWPESIKTVGAMNDGSIIKILEKIEYFLYRNSKAVISVTESFNKQLIDNGIDKDKLFVIRNGVNLKNIRVMPKDESIIKNLNLNNKFVVGYIGTMGMAHGLSFILNSIKKLNDDNIVFLFIGSGAKRDELLNLKDKLNLKNVIFLPMQTKENIKKYISVIDVALVNLRKSDNFKKVIPSKIFEQAAMKKPILLGVDGEAREIVEKYKAGLFYHPENEKEFIDTLLRIKNDKKLYKELSENCLKLANDFDRKKLAREMYEIIKKIL